MSGLGEEWGYVLKALTDVSEHYDRVNRWISFGMDVRLRRIAVAGRLTGSRWVLDAGCGTGMFARIALEENPFAEVVMLDPLPAMLRQASGALRGHFVQAVFEYLPFRPECFERVLLGFSLRDARDSEKATRELSTRLEHGGSLIICDISKPNDRLRAMLFRFYWLLVAPVLGFLASGRRGLTVSAIRKTYDKWPSNDVLAVQLGRFFASVEVHPKMMGGAVIMIASRKS